jgi:hypothetical protein
VSFPGTMSDDDVSGAIRQHLASQPGAYQTGPGAPIQNSRPNALVNDAGILEAPAEVDDEAPEAPSLWDRVKRAGSAIWAGTPAGMAGSLASDLADWAHGKAQKNREENLAAAAQGKPATHSEITNTLLGSGGDVASAAEGAVSPESLAIAAGLLTVPEYAGPYLLGQGLKEGIGHGIKAARSTTMVGPTPMVDPDELQESLSGLSEAAGGGASIADTLDGGLGNTATGRVVKRAGNSLQSAMENVGLSVPEAPKALAQAIQPGVSIPNAAESIDIAGPRLQQVRQATGMEFKSPADLLEGVQHAKQYVYDAIEQRLGPVDQLQADTSPVANAMENSIAGRTARQYPDLAQAIRERADTYRQPMALREIEDSIQAANNDLRNLYKRPGMTDSPISAETTATEAEVRSLRSLLDQKVQDLSGAGVADLKREYGALRDVERAAARQNAVATRQKGATLWEGLAGLRAAGDFVSGNALGAAKGAATIAMGRWLSKLRDPNYLIDQAFQGSKAFEPAAAIRSAPGPKISGLLPPGPTELPLGEPGGESGPMPGQGRAPSIMMDIADWLGGNGPNQEPTTRAERLGLLLPESTSPTRLPLGEPGGESGPLPGQGRAPSIVQRDPRTGKMRRIYVGQRNFGGSPFTNQ